MWGLCKLVFLSSWQNKIRAWQASSWSRRRGAQLRWRSAFQINLKGFSFFIIQGFLLIYFFSAFVSSLCIKRESFTFNHFNDPNLFWMQNEEKSENSLCRFKNTICLTRKNNSKWRWLFRWGEKLSPFAFDWKLIWVMTGSLKKGFWTCVFTWLTIDQFAFKLNFVMSGYNIIKSTSIFVDKIYLIDY